MNRTSFALAATVGLALAWATPARADVAACIHAAESAQPLRASGRLLAARAELIKCAAESCPNTVRQDCVAWLTEIRSEIPSIVVQARDGRGADMVGVSVAVDGVVVKTVLDGLPIAVDPGARRVRFESPGRTPIEQTVVLRQGERERLVSVTILKPGEVVERPSAPAVAESTRRIPTISWVLGGTALALAGTGAALWVVGRSDRTDLQGTCGTTSSCAHDDIVSSRTKLIAGDVLMGAGIVALGAGVYFALSSRTSAPKLSIGPRGLYAVGSF